MADSWMQNVPCRFFVMGTCREGENCRYSHNLNQTHRVTQSQAQNQSQSTVCRYFQRGSCVYGEECRYLHMDASSNCPHSTDDTESIPSGNRLDQNAVRGCISSSLSVPLSSGSTSQSSDCREVNHIVLPTARKQDCVESDEPLNVSRNWINAPEFVPSTQETSNVASGQKSYAEAVDPHGRRRQDPNAEKSLCPYAEAGQCQFGIQCEYLHGDMCDMCHCLCLHPTDEEQRKQHAAECVRQHERDMELSFAIARSKDKTCGICFETVMEKSPCEQRFGILSNCNHCFCLACIRKWRQARQFDRKIIKSCPECRVSSDFVCPSMYWVDTMEDKDKIITDYKNALSTKDCKYFRQGKGKCFFGNKCFYLHAYPDGTKVDVGPPERPRGRNANGEVLQHIILWDFLEDRDIQWSYEDLMALFSDSEDSDWSDDDL